MFSLGPGSQKPSVLLLMQNARTANRQAFGFPLYGMHPVVCLDIANGAVYTTVSTNVHKDKSILMYHRSFSVQRCSATCFDLHEVIIRITYKN
jgi:hypothetical protein